MKRAALYVRVSTAEQKKYGISVENQIDSLRSYCNDNELEIVSLYNDAGKSATKYKTRPELLRMISDCQAGRVDVILFTRLDRFFRSVPDYYECMKLCNDTPWIAIWEPDYRTDTAAGMFNVNLRLALNQNEAAIDSERIKSVKAFCRSQGNFMGGKPAIGFKIENKKAVPDPEMIEPLRRFFNDYIEYKPLRDCLFNAGLKMSRNAAINTLKSERYIGPFITQKDHEDIIRRIENTRTRRPKDPGYYYLFNGIVCCGCCGFGLSSLHRRRHSAKRGDYDQKLYSCYHFKCEQFITTKCAEGVTINEDILEALLLAQLDAALSAYKFKIEATSEDRSTKLSFDKIKRLNERVKRLAELYELGDLSKNDYVSKRDALKREISLLEAEIKPKPELPDIPDNWREIYDSLNLEDRAIFWHRIIKKIIVSRNHKIDILFN